MSKERDKYIKETKDGTSPGSCMMVPTGAYGKDNIGIGHFGYDFNPCNAHLETLAKQVQAGFVNGGSDFKGDIFAVTGVSDGISMGYDAMRHSLVSRDTGALSIINHVSAAPYEGIILIPGCDKNMPASAMALLSMDMPGYILSGGSIKPGHIERDGEEEDIDIVDSFVAAGAKAEGTITEEERRDIQEHACPGFGACGGMYTANSMFTLFEAMGLSPLHSSSIMAEDKAEETANAYKVLEDMIKSDRKPSDFIDKRSFENAARSVCVLGGSTNPIMHLRAMARASGIDFTEADFERISKETPFISNLMPSGEYRMADLARIGGTPAMLKYMLDNGHLDGSAKTLTGLTIAEDLASIEYDIDAMVKSNVIKPFSDPILARGHLVLLEGNLGIGWTKISGSGDAPFEGRVVVFDSESDFHDKWEDKVKGEGDIIVIRYEGPKGSPGMPEMLKPTTALVGRYGKKAKIGLMTDGRFSGGSVGGAPIIGHIDEAYLGSTIAILKDNDKILIEPKLNKLNVLLDDSEIENRKKDLKVPDKVMERIKNSPQDLKFYHKQASSPRDGATMLFD